MKKKLFISLLAWASIAHSADLIEVYRDAQFSDPQFQQAVAQRLSTKEGVPINVAGLLPNISFTGTPAITRYGYAGTQFTTIASFTPNSYVTPRNLTQRTYTMNLTATQTIFNFAQFSGVAAAVALSKGSDAILNAALQDLMIRVSTAYFQILQDEDNLSYTAASKAFLAEQLDQTRQQYNVGLKTLTDVYTAEAQFASAGAKYIIAETTLKNDRENLRVMTGKYYTHLNALSENFPLLKPQPMNVDRWVTLAARQNWSIRSAQYTVESNRQLIHQQFAGHLPTVNVQATLGRQYLDNINGYTTLDVRNGPGTITQRQVALNVTVPLFSGGQVTAQTNQAFYNYQIAQQQLEQTLRGTLSTTRQSYLNVISGISLVAADKQAIRSNVSSLEGLEASYRVGTGTLVDVLNQQQKLVQAQITYAQDRYAFVKNILALKQAAGTLSFTDICALNRWLINKKPVQITPAERKAATYKYPIILGAKRVATQSS